MKLKEIVWDDGQYSCYEGKINGLRVASVTWESARSKSTDGPKWKVALPLFNMRLKSNASTAEEGKAVAAIWLTKLISDLMEQP